MPNCDKKFGSKNDWKRHENTQHFMPEIWKCDVESCEVVCQNRDEFRAHAGKAHEIVDQSKLEAMLDKCRIGRNCETRFWCGFCNEIVEIKQTGDQAWTERFDHIGEHFSSRNQEQKDISEWKDVDPSRRSQEPSKDDSDTGDSRPSPVKKAKASRDGSRQSSNRPKLKRKREDGNKTGSSKKSRTLVSQGLICVSE
jgi:hypothetical protein